VWVAYVVGATLMLALAGHAWHELRAWWTGRVASKAERDAAKDAKRARAAADETLAKVGHDVDAADARAEESIDDARRATLEDWARKNGAGQ
jgi:hypothetical protein